MATVESPVNELDMLTTVKSRHIQRGMLAEMRGNRKEAAMYLLSAAHMELILGDQYAQAGKRTMEYRSRLSAASCFWRGGQIATARKYFDALIRDFPDQAKHIKWGISDLEKNCPTRTGKKRARTTLTGKKR